MKWSKEFAAGYVAGLIDGEGSVAIPKQGTRSIRVSNTDPDIIETYMMACSLLGIETGSVQTTRTPSGKEYYIVPIYGRENFEKVRELIPFVSQAKQAKLDRVIGDYVERINPDLEQIRMLKSRGVSNRAIAEAFGYKSHHHINKLIREHGLV